MKYITIKLTKRQILTIIRDLEFEMVDSPSNTAYEERLVEKLRKALAND